MIIARDSVYKIKRNTKRERVHSPYAKEAFTLISFKVWMPGGVDVNIVRVYIVLTYRAFLASILGGRKSRASCGSKPRSWLQTSFAI